MENLICADGEILLRLKKSRIRREVLFNLAEVYPEVLCASQIALKLHCNLGDAGGVIHGSKPRYRSEDSLIALGLVEESVRMSGYMTNVKFYKATPKGLFYSDILKKRKDMT